MKAFRIFVGVVSSALALSAISFVTVAPGVLAQENPHVGTWVLNVAKSKYSPGPAPKEQTSVYSMAGKALKVSTKGTSGDGKPISMDFTANFDGTDAPVKGSADYDATAVRQIDSHTIEFTRKRAGKTVQTATSVVSKDGKTRTITVTGVNAQGQKMSTVGVYEKK